MSPPVISVLLTSILVYLYLYIRQLRHHSCRSAIAEVIAMVSIPTASLPSGLLSVFRQRRHNCQSPIYVARLRTRERNLRYSRNLHQDLDEIRLFGRKFVQEAMERIRLKK